MISNNWKMLTFLLCLENMKESSESKVESIRTQLDSTIEQARILREQLIQSQEAKTAAEQLLQEKMKEEEKHTCTVENIADESLANHQVGSLTAEKAQLFERLDKKDLEIKDKQHELDSFKKALTISKQNIVELESKVDDLRVANGVASTTEHDLKKNIELLKEHIEYLEKESISAKSTNRNSDNSAEQISILRQKMQTLQESFTELDKQHDELKESYRDLTKKHFDSANRVSELENIQKLNQESFQVEMDAQKKLVALWEKSAKTAKARVQHLEKVVSSKQLQSSSRDSATTPTEPATPLAPPDLSTVFSPAAQRIAELQKGGNSLTKIYSDLQNTRSELEHEKTKNRSLQDELNLMLREMESHTPAIIAERQENQRLENELNSLGSQLETASVQFAELTSSLRENETFLEQDAEEIKLLKIQVHDLSRQLKQAMFEKQDSTSLTEEDKDTLQRILDGENLSNFNANTFISEKLVPFTSIMEMQQQNENLLKLTRKFQRDSEQTESILRQRIEEAEAAAVNEVKSTIEDLQATIGSFQTKIDTLERERDMYRTISANRKEASHDNESDNSVHTTKLNALVAEKQQVEKMLEEVNREYKSYKSETVITLKALDDQIVKVSNENSLLQVQISKTTTQLELSVDRFKALEGDYETLRNEIESHKKRTESFQNSLLKQEERNEELSNELASTRSSFAKLTKETSNHQEEKRLWRSVEERLEKEKTDLAEERDRLSNIVSRFKSLESERAEYEKKSSEKIAAYEQKNNKLLEAISTHEEKIAHLEAVIVSETEKTKTSEERIYELTQKLAETGQVIQKLYETIESHDEKLSQAVNEVQTRLNGEKAILEEQLAQFIQRHANEIEALTKKNELISNDLPDKLLHDRSEHAETDSNYNTEVFRHAETTKKLEALSQEYHLLQEQITELTNTVEAASANLLSSETTWNSERMELNSQINSLKLQVHDALQQKSKLQKKIDEHTQNDLPPTYEASAATVESLRENVYELKKNVDILNAKNTQLQEENEILETNQSLTDQELKRLRRNLDFKISEAERYKINLQNVTECKIQPLVDDNNILKESNIALREQRDEFSKQAVKLGEELEKLKGLESQLKISLSEVKKKDEALKELNFLKAKFNGIEPEKINSLKTENDALKKSSSSLTTQLLSQQSELHKLKTELAANSQVNSAKLQQKLQEAEAKATKFEADFQALELKHVSLRNEFQEKMNTRRIQAKNQLLEATTTNTHLTEEIEALKKAAMEQTAQTNTANEKLVQLNQKVNELENFLKVKEDELEKAKLNIAAQETELMNLKSLNQHQTEHSGELAAEKQKLVVANEQIIQLKNEKLNLNETIQKLQVEFDELKASAAKVPAHDVTSMVDSTEINSSDAKVRIAELENQVAELEQKVTGVEELTAQNNALQVELQEVPARISKAIQQAEADKAEIRLQLKTLQDQQKQNDIAAANAEHQKAFDLALSEKAALEIQVKELRAETEQQKADLTKVEKLQVEKTFLERQLEALQAQHDSLPTDNSDEDEKQLELEKVKLEKISLEQQLQQARQEKADFELKIASLTTALSTPVLTLESDEERKQRALIEFNLSTPEELTEKLDAIKRKHLELIAEIERKLLEAKNAELESIKADLKTELSKAHEKQLAEIKLKAQTKVREAVDREKERLAAEYKTKSAPTALAPTSEVKPIPVTAENLDSAVKEQVLSEFRTQAEAEKTAALNKLKQESEMRIKLLQMKLTKLKPQTAAPVATTPPAATLKSSGGSTGPTGKFLSAASGSSLGSRLSGIPRASGIPRPNAQTFIGNKRQAPGGANGAENIGGEPGNKKYKRNDNGTAKK